MNEIYYPTSLSPLIYCRYRRANWSICFWVVSGFWIIELLFCEVSLQVMLLSELTLGRCQRFRDFWAWHLTTSCNWQLKEDNLLRCTVSQNCLHTMLGWGATFHYFPIFKENGLSSVPTVIGALTFYSCKGHFFFFFFLLFSKFALILLVMMLNNSSYQEVFVQVLLWFITEGCVHKPLRIWWICEHSSTGDKHHD